MTLAVAEAFAPAIAAAIRGTRATDGLIRAIEPTMVRLLAAEGSSSPRDEYVRFLKDLALSMAKKQVLGLIIPALPAKLTTGLVGSIFNPFLGLIVGMTLEFAIEKTELGMFFLYIDMRTSAQGRAFEKSARANLEAQKNGSPAEREKAEKELIRDFKAFVKLTN